MNHLNNLSNDSLPLVLFLMGPTASGKTDLAIELGKHLPTDIISVDSALIYRSMDIGTAKPTAEELTQAPHRLIDICDPAEHYSVADFCRDAVREIDDIVAANRIPLLVGGTMMYFKALLEGLSDMPATDQSLRDNIAQEAEEKGWPFLHQQLQEIDPEYAATIHPNHSQRIGRALEVYRLSGQTMTELRSQQTTSRPLANRFRVVQMALLPEDRAVLHQRIERRFLAMLEQGFVDEVKALHSRGDLHLDLPSMRAVGYRQVWQYLASEYDYPTMVEKGVAATRQLAKRQLTWLKSWSDLQHLPVNQNSLDKNVELILNFLPLESI